MHYPPATWRLLLEPHPRPGTLNMAIDEAVLRSVAAHRAPPTLRLYGWAPPALTLGRGQPYADADVDALRRGGVALLRRMTGGTAVLNRDELTYAVAATVKEPRFSAANIAESYRGISGALLVALERLGLAYAEASGRDDQGGAERGRRATAAGRSPVCFEIPSDYEITVEGRKLVGSSQMRVRGGILQHGSLPLAGDIGDIGAFLTARPDPLRVRRHALTLHDALGRTVTWEEAAEAVMDGFREALNLTLLPGPLTPDERKAMERLIVEKYGNADWTARV
jgi:lipoate-protein ligase A